MEIAITALVLILCLALYVPIAFSVLFSAITFIVLSGASLDMIPQQLHGGVYSYSLLALTLFVTAGIMMERGDISTKIFNFAASLVGHIKGGLGLINVLNSMLFGGVTGSGVADVAATGSIMIPQMVKRGYSKGFSAAITSCSASIGIVIPPSIPMVIYGISSGTSIGTMFVAGILPGILTGLGLMAAVRIQAGRFNFPVEKSFSFQRMISTFKPAILPLLMPVIIIAGMTTGIFTATEAGGIAAVYGLLLYIIYGQFEFKRIYGVLVDAVNMTAVVMLIVGASAVLGWILSYLRIPQLIASSFLSLTNDPVMIIIMAFFLMVFFGAFIHGAPLVILITPIMMPLVHQLGIEPVFFGIVVIMAVGIGQETPPVGSTMIVASTIANTDIITTTKANLPHIFTLIIIALAIIFIPEIALFIPRVLGLM